MKDGNTQTRSSTTSVGVSHDETLQVIAIFSWLLNVWKNIQQEFSRCTCVQKKGCTTNNSPIMFTSQLLVCWRAWKRLSFVVTERKSKLTQRTFLCTICQQTLISLLMSAPQSLLNCWNGEIGLDFVESKSNPTTVSIYQLNEGYKSEMIIIVDSMILAIFGNFR